MRPIKLLPVLPHMLDATSFYRGQKPLTELAHTKNLQLCYSQEISWATMALADILFLQRPFTNKEHVIMAQVCEKSVKKLWCDWDDDLFTVPPDNPAHGVYIDKEVQTAVAILAAMADVVTVSTPVLAKRFNAIREKAQKSECIIIPNALSDHFIERRKHTILEGKTQERILDPKRRKLIFWRGSASHQADLDSVTPHLIDLLKSELGQTWTLHFMGYNPYRVTNELPRERCIVGGGMDILDYIDYFQCIMPGITIVPLVDSEFNRAKSNIAWLEATLAQSLVVAPDFEEWRRPGIFNYKDQSDFLPTLIQAMKCVEASDYSRVDESWNYITENLLLSKVNEQRWQIIQNLAPHKPQN